MGRSQLRALPAHIQERPNAFEVEKQVIGAMLVDNRSIAESIGRIDEKTFSDRKHWNIYETMVILWKKGIAADIITVGEELVRRGLAAIPVVYLVDMERSVTSGANVNYHIQILLDKQLLREEIEAGMELTARAFDPTEDSLRILNEMTAHLSELRSRFGKIRVVNFFHVAEETTNFLDSLQTGKHVGLVHFGFQRLDEVCGGMMPGNLIVLAAPEKRGKTSLALQIMLKNANSGVPVLLESGEMKRVEVMLRLACIDERVRWIDVIQKKLSSLEWERLFKRVASYSALPIYVREGQLTLDEIAADTQIYTAKHGVQLVVVDYLQQVKLEERHKDNREQELSEIAYGLKDIANLSNVPVLALSAVNDDLRTRGSRGIQYAFDKGIKFLNQQPENFDGNDYAVDFEITQRMGLSGVLGDVKLRYSLAHGTWHNEQDTPEQTQMGF